MTKMNKAVAAAVLAMSASAAQAGIIIPAGDWTVDIGGNVNAYYTHTNYGGSLDQQDTNTIQTGLLPTALGIGAKSRQGDYDVSVQFSFFTGINTNGGDTLNPSHASPAAGTAGNGGLGYSSLNIRQSFLTFGDKSWGTIKMGRDLGTFGSDAILSDMTLLGVGSNGGATGSSTLGRIGSGYLYADWVAQIQYASPNWNGFSFQVAAREAMGQLDNNELSFDGKVSYEWAGDLSGKVWVGGITGKIQEEVGAALTAGTINERDADAWEIGGKVGMAGFELVGYYYDGQNMDGGAGVFPGSLISSTSTTAVTASPDRDNSGGYVQLTYKIPGVGTKIGASWGENNIDKVAGEVSEDKREAWVIGAYHPLTKSVNLVAEYNDLEVTDHAGVDGDAKTISLGAILFF